MIRLTDGSAHNEAVLPFGRLYARKVRVLRTMGDIRLREDVVLENFFCRLCFFCR